MHSLLGYCFKPKSCPVGVSLIFPIILLTILTDLSQAISLEKDTSLTASEKRALDKFRLKVSPLLYRDFMRQDLYLTRWLRARNFDVNLAESMLRAHTQWRKENNMDTILEEDWSDMMTDFHATMDTYDREGRPIGTIDIYDWDIRTGVLQGRSKRGLRYMSYLLENVTMQVFQQQAKGYNVTQWKVMGNADGFNFVKHGCAICIPLWIQLIQLIENHYIGWADEIIIVDAPPALNPVLEAIRPFLSRATKETFRIFGPNKSKWMPYMDERVSKEQRRAAYGGTKP